MYIFINNNFQDSYLSAANLELPGCYKSVKCKQAPRPKPPHLLPPTVGKISPKNLTPRANPFGNSQLCGSHSQPEVPEVPTDCHERPSDPSDVQHVFDEFYNQCPWPAAHGRKQPMATIESLWQPKPPIGVWAKRPEQPQVDTMDAKITSQDILLTKTEPEAKSKSAVAGCSNLKQPMLTSSSCRFEPKNTVVLPDSNQQSWGSTDK